MEIKARILYRPTVDNPDNKYEYVGKTIDGRREFSDTYYIDLERFGEVNQVISYIVQDLKTIASGGYCSDKVYDTVFKISFPENDIEFTEIDMRKVLKNMD